MPTAAARRRRLRGAGAALGLAAVTALVVPPLPVLAAPSPSVPAPSSSPSGSPPSSGGDGRGELLYGRACASCHGYQGEGTQRGPTLAGVGPASVDFQLSTGRMPLNREKDPNVHQQPAFSADDIRALVDHVAAFPPGGGPAIPQVQPGDPRAGRELYLTYCSACHSATGVGATLNNGRFAPSLFRATPVQVGEAIRVGPGLMPAFGPAALSDGDVDAIAGYVGVLQGDYGDLDRGGFWLWRLGPFPEGVVAWLVGMGVLLLGARLLGSRVR
ncbi:c-type cytochrome [Dactylosporangium aurantiacum]|uniref:C-type cytochrome n=1 Tax=Dactylosporangium aurantiacum TaxID=35754 RepID=A0A9Q9IN22_9ACTN|nr:c-type cytochrome [Dactylosporangium aurantiacum]MDG6110197.1 c-type cytochrome [Dactylosporangium aurantiacum]UWZ58656.1 c-type cytochrome [Dactylosporangium aurantiacum]